MAHKINFSEMVLKDLDGKPYDSESISKTIAQMIHLHARNNLDLLQYCIPIHNEQEVELSTEEVKQLKKLAQEEKCKLSAFMIQGIIDFIDEQVQPKKKSKKE